MESLNIILERASKVYETAEKEQLAEKKNGIYRGLLERMTPADLPQETAEVLHALKDSGVNVAIGSSSKNARVILERLGLGNFFDEVSDGTMISQSKPDPEVFLKAAQMLGKKPEECLVVEDAKAGILAAAAGDLTVPGLERRRRMRV